MFASRRGMLAVAIVGAAIGLVAGVGAYTFVYARGGSYLTNDPSACANCHIMNEQYDSWSRSSHHAVAVCNDCHVPHDLVGKYLTKMRNGWEHSYAFTTGDHPDPIVIKDHSLAIVESGCRHCHAELTASIEHGTGDTSIHHVAGLQVIAHASLPGLSCVRCHNAVGHAR